jgi:transposase
MSRMLISEEKCSKSKVFIGIDVHSNSFQVTPIVGNVQQRSRRLTGNAADLVNWASEKFPGAELVFGYEAGFSGLWLSRFLEDNGFKCKVLHPSDIPTTDKDRVHKNDCRDSRKIAACLRTGEYNEIFQIEREQEELRQLVRCGIKYSRFLKVSQQRIRMGLHLRGFGKEGLTQNGKKSWSKSTIKNLQSLAEEKGFSSILMDLNFLISQKRIMKQIWTKVQEELLNSSYKEVYLRYKTTPGIGPKLAAILTVEVGDMKRFQNNLVLKSYCGLVPGEKSSGEKVKVSRMSYRGNRHLRWALIQAARRGIQHDYELAKLYNAHHQRLRNDKKAIVIIATIMLRRLRRMMIDKIDYRINPTE